MPDTRGFRNGPRWKARASAFELPCAQESGAPYLIRPSCPAARPGSPLNAASVAIVESLDRLHQKAVLSARVQLDPSDTNRAPLQTFLDRLNQIPEADPDQ
jgi:hypothetical protein